VQKLTKEPLQLMLQRRNRKCPHCQIMQQCRERFFGAGGVKAQGVAADKREEVEEKREGGGREGGKIR
jgi:hypothetical protein